jgi:hypothetical protein
LIKISRPLAGRFFSSLFFKKVVKNSVTNNKTSAKGEKVMTVNVPVFKIETVQLKIYATADDKRNKFYYLAQIFIEQLDSCRGISICQSDFSLEAIELMEEIVNRLDDIFGRRTSGSIFKLEENFTMQKLIDALGIFKEGPILFVTPADLTYINVRLMALIDIF